ncbi:MAG: 2-oxoglutarate dehydrogenase E1 component [Bacteroidales bacterium]|nr:2-oxoglutarate dehydrogenase E1 component [Bacteroidales bacterium]MCF8456918.1 2-oxoglutarate dehydrogenase E1 component [Bacteroidales bacterium]
MDKLSFLGNSEIETIDEYYKNYLQNSDSVSDDWKNFFAGFEFARKNYDIDAVEIPARIDKEFKILNYINAVRKRGHLFTKTNPVRTRRKYFPTLDLENYDLSDADLTEVFHAGTELGLGSTSLQNIKDYLFRTYCHSVGVEYLFIREETIVNWLQKKMESVCNTPNFTSEEKKRFYDHLKQAVGFEKFIHKKFIGQKRFSLEGAEGLIPALGQIIEKGAEHGIEEFNIGMSHRGRLNVLANTLCKPYENIFKEYTGTAYEEGIAQGDVKYHLGYENTIETHTGKKVRVNLAPNPSHLETVSAIIQGITRARINNKFEGDYNKVAPIVIHGDAAIAAQGIVYEVAQMSMLEGYKTGGTIHLVVNNQVGFTTNYLEGRSSTYCTDIAKVIKSPVFHINGDDVESLAYVIELAIEFRQRFHRDVFIDILCYRKYGHNEGDEPRFTQPILYKEIAKHPTPREIYATQLIKTGVYTAEEIKQIDAAYDQHLESKFEDSKKIEKVKVYRFLKHEWQDFKYADSVNVHAICETGIEESKLLELASKINHIPEGVNIFKKVQKLVADRENMVKENRLDWAMGELLAYASLVTEGHSVRLSGQDSERGTFSHRHASWIIEDTDQKYYPLSKLSTDQAEFKVYNSLLSEYGVMGFEYGYALAHSKGLTIWEAQFGDFHNVAQVIIDQYISSAEDKWGLMNGLVLYLPHGYEGQGPEHSSARLERFLILCAGTNMQVVNCTTPGNLFHLLRRQVKRNFQIPLVLLTPKSLLRHPKCVSSVAELSEGHFRSVIDDDNVDVNTVTRLVFCSGKIYYDLLAKKEEYDVKDIAIVRIEQLHPFPKEEVERIIYKYPNTMLRLWVQEEPQNMGAWEFIHKNLLEFEIEPVSRLASGSPAVGLHVLHERGQNEIINKVFRRCDCERQNIYCGLQCVIGKSREAIMKQHHYIFEDE